MFANTRRLWMELRSGFWFLPSILLLAHVALAIVLTSTDLAANKAWMSEWPNLFGAGADGARGMLSTIAGSMMTVVGVTLSMTLVTLALASSQYTSRILRNFIGDRITQFVLGLFAGIFCYCVIVLRTIRGGDEGGFVPGLAVLAGVIMAVGSICVLIYFIHHIATSIQASNLIASVAAETIAAIEKVEAPHSAASSLGSDDAIVRLSGNRVHVNAPRDGYIEQIDFQALEEFAEVHGVSVIIERGMGDFVVKGAHLISLDKSVTAAMADEAVGSAVSIGRHRTVEQDVGFGIRQLVDIALRALSPGVNDTTTAVMCVDYLTAILTRVSGQPIPDFERPAPRSRRIIEMRPVTFQGLLAAAFDQIEEAGRGNSAMLSRLIDAIAQLAALPMSEARREILRDRLARLKQM